MTLFRRLFPQNHVSPPPPSCLTKRLERVLVFDEITCKTAVGSTQYGTESNHEIRANSYMGLEIGQEEQLGMRRKIGRESNLKMPLGAIFRQ